MPDAPEPLSRILTIVNQRGLHARAAAKLVKLAGQYDADIRVERAGLAVNGRSIMGLLLLAAAKDSEIAVSATGPEAETALQAVANLVEDGFGEL